MRGGRKTKKVSWAAGKKLRQVKVYSKEDTPSKVGEGAQPARTPLIEWKCPRKVRVSLIWQVAVGEESIEIQVQRQRESKLLEAIYPHASAIPPNPSVAPDASDPYDDSKTPLISLTPIEEKTLTDALYNLALVSCSDPPAPVCDGLALTIGGNPAPVSDSNPAPMTDDLALVIGGNPAPVSGDLALVTGGNPAPVSGSNTPPLVNNNGEPESFIYPPPPPDDINYCTSLIPHGGGNLEQKSHEEGRSEEKNDIEPNRSLTPCIFFNTPKGCKRSANCPFLHGSASAGGCPPHKKMKMKMKMKMSED